MSNFSTREYRRIGAKNARSRARSLGRLGALGAATLALAGGSLTVFSAPAAAAPTTLKLTAVVNQQTSDNGPAAWSTKNVTAASTGSSITFSVSVTGTTNPATGSISWSITGGGSANCGTTALVGASASCVVHGVQPPSVKATANYTPGNDTAASASDTVTVTTPSNAPFVSGTPSASPPFNECPTIGNNTKGCRLLILFPPSGAPSVLNNPNVGPYDGNDDTLVGVLNQSPAAVSSVGLGSSNTQSGKGIFGFDGDGGCSISNSNPGDDFALSWSVNAGKSLLTSAQTGCPYGPTGYEGPYTWFSGYSASNNYETGTVHFSKPGGLAPGSSAFFTLENSVQTLATSPAVTTTPAKASILLGQSNSDSATVTGTTANGAPTGNVNFYLCGPGASSCSAAGTAVGGAVATTQASANSATASSIAVTPNAPGTWCFTAVYSGNANYPPGEDNGTGECFSVLAQSPTKTTSAPAQSAIFLTQSNTDTVTVATQPAAGVPTGSVTFFLCGPGATSCSAATGTNIGPGALIPFGANSAQTTSPPVTPNATGSWCFAAVYAPTGTFAPSNDSTSDECFAVNPASHTVATSAPAQSSIFLGQSDSDGVTVATQPAAGAPTGSVSFYVCGPSATSCSAAGTPVPASGALAQSGANQSATTSVAYTPNATGTWCFAAVYAGTVSFATSQDGSADECFTVKPAQHTVLTTAPSPASITLGQSVQDGATVTTTPSAGQPTGTISFYVCGPGATGCTATTNPVASTGPLTPNGANSSSTTSVPFVPNAVGTWCFGAQYSPSSPAFAGSNDQTSDECFTVTGPTTTQSAPAQATIAVGASDTDTVTVTGVPSGGPPTGTVTFYSCTPSVAPCNPTSGTPLGSSSPASSAGDVSNFVSPPITPTSVGTWCFAALYNGSTLYNPSSDATSDECFTVTPATLSGFATTPSGATAGSSASDSATVTGNGPGGSPAGSISFYVCGPGVTSCSAAAGTLVGTSTLGAGSNDTASAGSAPYVPNAPGAYCYVAVYNPQAGGNYLAATGSNECFTVGQVSLSKSSSPSGVVSPGTVITYTITAANDGGAASGPVIVKDAAPPGTTYASSSCGGVPGCTVSQSAGVVTFTLPSVAANASEQLSFSVTVNSGVTADISNVATFSGPNCTSAISCSSPSVSNPVADIVVSKASSRGSGQVNNGSPITYTLNAASIGTAPASAVVTDPLGTGVTYVAGSAACPSNASASTCTASYSAGTNTVTFTITNEPAATTYALSFQVKVNDGDPTGQVISNTGFYTGQGCVPAAPMTSCPTNTTTNSVLDIIMTGRAYGLAASVTLVGQPLVSTPPTPDTGSVATAGASTTNPGCTANLMGLINSGDICASVTTALDPQTSTAVASTANLGTAITGVPVVQTNDVSSTSTTTCAGSIGSTSIAFLSVGGTVLINNPSGVTPAPNTMISIAGITVILNEQVPISNGADRGLTVNAIHIEVNLPGVATADIVVDSSTSDIENCLP